MRDVLDVHTHTLASGHAYSTLREMARMASEKGLHMLGITEHGVKMPGTCHSYHFQNLKVIPREMYGVELMLGVELNIMDFEGTVDMEEYLLKEMDVTVASIHPPCIRCGSKEENTRAYVKAMENPYVNIIGHPDDGRFPVDYEQLVYAAKENDVLLEINNSSLAPGSFRENARENYMEMLSYCKDCEVSVIMGSDAHIDTDVGNHHLAAVLLEETGFPETLVVNRHVEEVWRYLNKYKIL